ncbi:MAG: hypothetical protein GEV13_01005 [Rhodospirillales bacterium]|nr:hypothetical protein [Rhodospirillales bacterium]
MHAPMGVQIDREEQVSEFAKRPALSLEEEIRAMEDWRNRGLSLRCARALARFGILTIEDLHAASDHQLSTIPNVARKSLVEIYRFIGRTMPGNARTPEQIQAGYEKEWRAKVGNDRFEGIIDSIVEMAGEALDRPSVTVGQALWAAARRRRAGKQQR